MEIEPIEGLIIPESEVERAPILNLYISEGVESLVG
jgi:hypothetical protein